MTKPPVIYNITYAIPHNVHTDCEKGPMLKFLARHGYESATLTLSDDRLSGTLSLGHRLSDEDLNLVANSPHTTSFEEAA
jgi:hypothetical protein